MEMKAGVDLGWRMVRAAAVTERGEILSIPDAQSPQLVETAPVVARSEGGALVGRHALALAAEGEMKLAGGPPKHAFAAAATRDSEALTLLLLKVARDLHDFGLSLDEMTFCVHDDILSPDSLGNSSAFETAAFVAGFANARYVGRAQAASLYLERSLNDNGFLPATRGADIRDQIPCKILLDVGFRHFRVSSVSHALFGGALPFEHADARDTPQASEGLLKDYYGHFASVAERMLPEKWSDAFTLDTLWTLVRDQKAAQYAMVLDADRKPRLFDVFHCRSVIASDVRRDLEVALQRAAQWASFKMVKEGTPSNVILIGEYANVPGISAEVDRCLASQFGKPIGAARPLPSHALAAAMALEVPEIYLTQAQAVESDERSNDRVRGRLRWRNAMPINDGEFPVEHLHADKTQLPEPKEGANADKNPEPKEGAESPIDPINLLDRDLMLVSLEKLDGDLKSVSLEKLDDQQLGRMLGSLWASQVDKLLRHVATAPTVELKAVYEARLRACGIEGGQLSPVEILKVLQPTLEESIKSRGKAIAPGWEAFSNGFTEKYNNALLGLGHTLESKQDAGPPFIEYTLRQRKIAVPEGKELTLAYNISQGGVARLPTKGLSLPDRLMVGRDKNLPETPYAPNNFKPEDVFGLSSDGFRPLLASSFLPSLAVSPLRERLSEIPLAMGWGSTWDSGRTWWLIFLALLLVLGVVLAY
jgi:hypothetical protein